VMACANVDNPYLDNDCTTQSFICSPSCSLDAVTCEPVNYPSSIMVVSTLAASGADIGNLPGTVFTGVHAWNNPQDAIAENGTFATVAPGTNETSNWLVAVGFGLNIPLTSTILGVRPVFKGKTEIGTDGTSFFSTYLADTLLTVGGNYFVSAGDLTIPFPGRASLADDGLTINFIGANVHFGCNSSTPGFANPYGCANTSDNGWIDGLNWWNYTCANIYNNFPDPIPVNKSFNPTTQLWLRSWTPAEINDPSFGVGLQVQNNLVGVGPPTLTAYVDCMGVAVYYVDSTPPVGPPTGNPYETFC